MKGSGSWIRGVSSDSGWVRSSTSIDPSESPSIKEPSVSIPILLASVGAERLLQPFSYHVGHDLYVEHERLVPAFEPLLERPQVIQRSHRGGARSEAPSEPRQVWVRVPHQINGTALGPEVVHLRAVRGVVVHHDQHWDAEPDERLELARSHEGPAVPQAGHGEPVGSGYRRPDRRRQPEPDRLKRLREHEP